MKQSQSCLNCLCFNVCYDRVRMYDAMPKHLQDDHCGMQEIAETLGKNCPNHKYDGSREIPER